MKRIGGEGKGDERKSKEMRGEEGSSREGSRRRDEEVGDETRGERRGEQSRGEERLHFCCSSSDSPSCRDRGGRVEARWRQGGSRDRTSPSPVWPIFVQHRTKQPITLPKPS